MVNHIRKSQGRSDVDVTSVPQQPRAEAPATVRDLATQLVDTIDKKTSGSALVKLSDAFVDSPHFRAVDARAEGANDKSGTD